MPATDTPTFKSERTEVLYGFEKTTEAIMSFLDSAEVSVNICADYAWPLVAMGVEAFKKGLYDLNARSVQSRFLTDITKDRGSTFMFTLPITNLDSVRDDSNQI